MEESVYRGILERLEKQGYDTGRLIRPPQPELDTSAYPIYISRIQLMARYRYGEYVSGYSFGLGFSF
jgi:hypothetical protein